MFVATEPYCGFPAASPPSTSTRPSASTVCPAQNMFLPAGSGVMAPVFVSRILAPAPSSKNSTDDVPGISTACCITVPPELTGADHDPNCAWLPPPPIVVVVVLVLVGVLAGCVVAVVAGVVCGVVDEPVTGTHAAAANATTAATRSSGRRRRG